MFFGCRCSFVKYIPFRTCRNFEQTYIHTIPCSKRIADMFPFRGDSSGRLYVRTDWCISSKITSDSRRVATVAEFLRFRRVYKSRSADELCWHVSGFQDGGDTGCHCRGSILEWSQVFTFCPLSTC